MSQDNDKMSKQGVSTFSRGQYVCLYALPWPNKMPHLNVSTLLEMDRSTQDNVSIIIRDKLKCCMKAPL